MSDETRYHKGIDLDLLAWDISDAFAKDRGDQATDFGMDEIKAALPAFIDAIRANAGH